jgi:hypothetical protein
LAGGQKSTRRSGRLVRIAHFQTKATGLGNRPVPGRTQEQIGDLEAFLADERAKLTKELTAARDRPASHVKARYARRQTKPVKP